MPITKPVNESVQAVSLSELRWQCRRGMLELDILLNTFLDRKYSQLNETQHQVFTRLLQYPDQTLFDLLMANMPSTNPDIAEMVQQVRMAMVNKNRVS